MNWVQGLMLAVQRLTVGEPHDVNDGPVRRLLLLSTTGLGDTVVSTAAVAAACELFPEAEIDFLVSHPFAPLLVRLAEQGFPRLQVIGIGRGWRGVLELWGTLYRRRYDTAIALHGNEPRSTALCVLACIPRIVKLAKTGLMSPLWSTRNAWAFPDARHHLVEKRLDMLRLFRPIATGAFRPVLPESLAGRAAAARWLADRRIPPDQGPLIALQVCAAERHREWPSERWIEYIGRWLTEQPTSTIVLSGSAAEAERLHALQAAVADARVHVNAGQVDMAFFPEFLRAMSLLVTGDTGTMHVGAASGVRMVGLFGASDPRVTGPYPLDERACCIHPLREDGSYAGMTAISVDDVLVASRRLLAGSEQHGPR